MGYVRVYNPHMTLKKTLALIVLILLGGSLPIFIYLTQTGGLGISEMARLQTVNSTERSALIASLLTIKPIYLLLCVAIILTLWGRASFSAQALFWGFSALISGELICGAVFSAFKRELIVSEHIHGFGMALEFSALAFALINFLDCRTAQTQTRNYPIFEFVALLGIFAAFLPLTVLPIPSGYQADLFGFPYSYARFPFNQWVESRALPWASIILFLCVVFWTTLRANEAKFRNLIKAFLSLAIGLLVFSLLRLTLGALFAERLIWFEFWEEATQLILIASVAFWIWRFRRAWILEQLVLFRVL